MNDYEEHHTEEVSGELRRTLLPPAIPDRIGTPHELRKYAPFVAAEVHLHARQKGNLESPLRLTCRTVPILADTSASAGNSIASRVPLSMFPIPMFVPERSWVPPGEGTGEGREELLRVPLGESQNAIRRRNDNSPRGSLSLRPHRRCSTIRARSQLHSSSRPRHSHETCRKYCSASALVLRGC